MNRRRIAITSMRLQRGAAMVEYAIVTVLVALVLVGNPGVVGEVIAAIKRMYQAFTYAISQTIQ